MRLRFVWLSTLGLSLMLASSAAGDTIYNNLTPNNSIGMASRPDTTAFEIETGDDFLLQGEALITSAAFDGLLVPGIGGTPSISQVVVEIYRVFPNDSDTTRTPAVPTRNNSPSDNAFASKDSSLGELNFTSAQLAASFTTVNSVQPGGIHLNTTGNGPLTGSEVEINVTFSTPFDLQPDHYFFVPQVELSNGGVFYWLSASRPITGFGTTPFLPDLQVWTRDASLDPDWLRVGTDIVGGMPAPTFNAAFALEGTPVPEPSSILLLISVLALFGIYRYRAARS